MTPESLAFIEKQLTYHGFNQDVKDKVKEALFNNVNPVVEIPLLMKQTDYATRQNLDIRYTLNLGIKDDKIYFNNYIAALAGKELKVHIGTGKNITAKEAFNLLQGRFVFRPEVFSKNREQFSAWVKVDFTQKQDNGLPKMLFFNNNYGYDIKAAVNRYDIKEMKDSISQAALLTSLERGNLQAVTLVEKGDKEQKVFIEAQPQYKSVNIYNQEGQKLHIGKNLILIQNQMKDDKNRKGVKI